MKAVLMVSHGSRMSKTKDEVGVLVNKLRNRLTTTIIDYAFLEIEHPNIPEGIDGCVLQGADEIVLLLNFLNAGQHVNRDIPSILEVARKKYPTVKFSMTPPVGSHPKMTDLFIDLINQS